MAKRPDIDKKAIRKFNKLVKDYLAPYMCSLTPLGISDTTRIVTFYGVTWAAVDTIDEEEGSDGLFTVFLRLLDPVIRVPKELVKRLGVNEHSGKWNFHITGNSNSVIEAFDQFRHHFQLMLPIRRDTPKEVFLGKSA